VSDDNVSKEYENGDQVEVWLVTDWVLGTFVEHRGPNFAQVRFTRYGDALKVVPLKLIRRPPD
jgi:hypothetical protein